MCSLKRTFLTGISRGIVKHSGNLCGTVGISDSQTGEIHLEVLQITHLREENVLQFRTNLFFKTSIFFTSQFILTFLCAPCDGPGSLPHLDSHLLSSDFALLSLKRQNPFPYT